jgi:hypothetical protein
MRLIVPAFGTSIFAASSLTTVVAGPASARSMLIVNAIATVAIKTRVRPILLRPKQAKFPNCMGSQPERISIAATISRVPISRHLTGQPNQIYIRLGISHLSFSTS